MSARYEIDYSDIIKLQEKFNKVPNDVEKTINDFLHKTGVEVMVQEITKYIPVSSKKKKHAKTSKWSKNEKHNLAFTIKTKGGAANNKGSFGYLVFPNEGRGPNNPVEQRFMEKGLEKATPKIIEELNNKIDQKIKEAFG